MIKIMDQTTGKDHSTDYQQVTVQLVDGSILNGKINISPHRRVSDFMKSRDKAFVVVTECCSLEITDKTIFVNKNKIAWVEPE